jgi:hypothetical protein
MNTLIEGNFFKNSGTLFLNSANTGLYVGNTAEFGGNVTISGPVNSAVRIQNPTTIYNTLTVVANSSILTSGFIKSNTTISSNSIFTNDLTVNANAYFNTTNALLKNIDGNSYQIISTKELNDVNTAIRNDLANTTQQINANISSSIANSTLSIYNYANNAFVRTSGNSASIVSIVADYISTGNLSVFGTLLNFGTTISDSNEYLFLANTGSTSSQNSQIIVNRSGGSPSNANAIIRWYNTGKEWQIRDIDNPTVFNKITTKNELDGANTFLYNYINSKVGGSSGEIVFGGDVTISGNLSINGPTTNLNVNTLTVDDKNITLGDVILISNTSMVATSTSNGTIIGNTAGLILGMSVVKLTGPGTPASGAEIVSINSANQFTLSANSQLVGAFQGNINGASDTSANGGGITVKGTTDKTFSWFGGTANAWTSSENISLVGGKYFSLSGSSSGATIIQSNAVANGILTLSNNTGTLVSTGDSGVVTYSMIASKTGTGNVVFSNNAVLVAPSFSVANGSAPFSVVSNTNVSNLNADLLDGQHGAYYTDLSTNAYIQANSAYTQANSAYIQANSAYNKANTIPALISTSIQTTNYTASVNQLVRCNTAAGAFSVTFPASPADGSLIGIIDIGNTFAANNVTLLPNGNTIESDATSVILDLNGSYASFVYNSATSNWKLLETPTGTEFPSAAGNTGNVLTSDGSNWVSGTLTYCTGLPLSTGVTGILPVANGGTGVTTSTGSGNNVLSISPTLTTPVLGVPSSGTLTYCTGLPLSTGVTGILPVANGGTGIITPGTTGNVLTSNGTAWVSQAAPVSLPTQTSNGGKFLTTDGSTATWSGLPLVDTTYTVTGISGTAANVSVDFSSANSSTIIIPLPSNTTSAIITFTNLASKATSNTVFSFSVVLSHATALANTNSVVWRHGAAVLPKWTGNIVPPSTVTANAIDIWTFFTYDAGSSLVGSLSMADVRNA